MGAAVPLDKRTEVSDNWRMLGNTAKGHAMKGVNHLLGSLEAAVTGAKGRGKDNADLKTLLEWKRAGIDMANVSDEIVELVKKMCGKHLTPVPFGATPQPTCLQTASVLARFDTMEWTIEEGVARFREKAKHPSKGGMLSNAGAIIGMFHADVKTSDFTGWLERVLSWSDCEVDVLGSGRVENEAMRMLADGETDDLDFAMETARAKCYPASDEDEPAPAAEKSAAEKPAAKERTCRNCGKELAPNQQKWCSQTCRRKKWHAEDRRRKREIQSAKQPDLMAAAEEAGVKVSTPAPAKAPVEDDAPEEDRSLDGILHRLGKLENKFLELESYLGSTMDQIGKLSKRLGAHDGSLRDLDKRLQSRADDLKALDERVETHGAHLAAAEAWIAEITERRRKAAEQIMANMPDDGDG